MKAREGDLIEDSNRILFDVKGLVQPPDRIVAFPRFIPSCSGNRQHRNRSYQKVYALSERFTFIKQNHPDYLVEDPFLDETLCEVPVGNVKQLYRPIEKCRQLREAENLERVEKKALRLAASLKEKASVSWTAIGVSGSILADLHTSNSDIDPIVYGSENCRKVHAALKDLLHEKRSPFRPYTRQDLKTLFDFRSKDTMTHFEDFVRTESRKALQGKFEETDYFVRFVKDWNEINETYGDVQYRNAGHARIEATVTDVSEAIFTPCKYEVENATIVEGTRTETITEIVSFRGRFCDQARAREVVVAQGKIERVKDNKRNLEHTRLLIGNNPSDFMILKP